MLTVAKVTLLRHSHKTNKILPTRPIKLDLNFYDTQKQFKWLSRKNIDVFESI